MYIYRYIQIWTIHLPGIILYLCCQDMYKYTSQLQVPLRVTQYWALLRTAITDMCPILVTVLRKGGNDAVRLSKPPRKHGGLSTARIQANARGLILRFAPVFAEPLVLCECAGQRLAIVPYCSFPCHSRYPVKFQYASCNCIAQSCSLSRAYGVFGTSRSLITNIIPSF